MLFEVIFNNYFLLDSKRSDKCVGLIICVLIFSVCEQLLYYKSCV